MEKYTEDALTLGQRLKDEERAASERRINAAILYGPAGHGWRGARQEREYVAQKLYEARYDGLPYWEDRSAEDVLNAFCWRIFNCSYAEVLEAWDRWEGK